MNTEYLAECYLKAKKKLKRYQKIYFDLYIVQQTTFTELIYAKKQLKLVQRIYWNHPEFRDDKDFIELYNSLSREYSSLKINYNSRCVTIKRMKHLINVYQSKIGKLNHKIKENSL